MRDEIDQVYHNQNTLEPASGADADFLPLDDPSVEGGEEEGEGRDSDGSMRSF